MDEGHKSWSSEFSVNSENGGERMEKNGWFLKYSGPSFEVIARFTDDEGEQWMKLERILFSEYPDIIKMKQERISIATPVITSGEPTNLQRLWCQ